MGGAVGIILAVPIAMIIINLYKAGVFRNFVYSVKLLLQDIGKLRRFDRRELVSEGIMTQEEADALDAAELEAAALSEKSSADVSSDGGDSSSPGQGETKKKRKWFRK